MNSQVLHHIETPSTPSARVIRSVGLLVLLSLELLGLTVHFDTQALAEGPLGWATWLRYAPVSLNIGLACMAAFLVIISPRLRTTWQAMITSPRRHAWGLWLLWHIVACGLFTLSTAAFLPVDTMALRHAWLWSMLWVLSGVGMLLCWFCAIAHPSFWWRLVRDEYVGLLGASLLGVGAWASGHVGEQLWHPLAEATLWLVQRFLSLLYTDVHYQMAQKLVGTATFQASIDPGCSGYEGIGLVVLLLSLYLWLFRAHLRFPQALMLLPIGALTVWLANAIRITVLIALGTSFSPAVAQGGFHSQAGWIAFLLVGLGLIGVSQRYRFWTVAPALPTAAVPHVQYATALLMPLLVLLGTMLVTSALSSAVDWLYPVRVLTTGLVLWGCRKHYRHMHWAWSWHALGCGMAVFGIWMALEATAQHSSTALADGLAQWPQGWAAAWLGMRVLGSVLVVPLAEELAFRGYLIHKLVAHDFETVRPGQFTWFACVLSSVLFGALHGRWLAGTIAGVCYALALRQRGQLTDAIVAHSTTNALIAAYVLSQQAWGLWA